MGEIKKQSIVNGILSYIGAFLGFLNIYLQPNLISSEDIGLLRLLFSFSAIISTILPLGFVNIIIRYFNKIMNKNNANNGVFALILLVINITGFGLLLIFYNNQFLFKSFFEKSKEFSDFFNLALFTSYILSLVAAYSAYSSILLKTSFLVFLNEIFVRCCQLIIIVIYHYEIISKHTTVIAYLGIYMLQLILLLVYLFKLKAISFKINWPVFREAFDKKMIYFGLLMTVTSFASLGLRTFDQFVLTHFLGNNLLGIYATSIMICVIIEIPFNSMDRIAQPKIAHAWNINNISELAKIYEMSSRYMFYIGGVIFCMLWASLDFIFLFLPPEYSQGKIVFYICSVSSLLNIVTGANSSVLLFSPKYLIYSVLLLLLIPLSAIAYYQLIPLLGMKGAALSVLITMGVFNIGKFLFLYHQYNLNPFSKHSVYILLSIVVSIGFILLISGFVNPFFKIVWSGIFISILFLWMNNKYNTVEEVNKVMKLILVYKKRFF